MQVVDLITESFERIGINPEQLSDYQTRAAERSISFIFREWSNKGLDLHKAQEMPLLDLQVGVKEYDLPDTVIDIVSAAIREPTGDEVDIGLSRIGIDTYTQVPQKSRQGKPYQYLFNRQIVPQMIFWFVPDRNYRVYYWAKLKYDDIENLRSLPDLTYRQHEAMCAALAARLAEKYQPDRYAMQLERANQLFVDAQREDSDGVSLQIRTKR